VAISERERKLLFSQENLVVGKRKTQPFRKKRGSSRVPLHPGDSLSIYKKNAAPGTATTQERKKGGSRVPPIGKFSIVRRGNALQLL